MSDTTYRDSFDLEQKERLLSDCALPSNTQEPRTRKMRRSWFQLLSRFMLKVVLVSLSIIIIFGAASILFLFGPYNKLDNLGIRTSASPGAVARPNDLLSRSCSCGGSIAAAKKLGCSYDTLAAAWLPPHCIDQPLTEEFNRAGPGLGGSWRYFSKPNVHSAELNTTALAALGDVHQGQFYATYEWHLKHCLFNWRKLWRSTRRGEVVLEKIYDNEVHIEHCGMLFMRREKLDAIVTGSGVNMNVDDLPFYTIDT